MDWALDHGMEFVKVVLGQSSPPSVSSVGDEQCKILSLTHSARFVNDF